MNNERLTERIKEKQKNLEILKDLFLQTAKAKSDREGLNYNLQKLLADSDDDESPGGSGTAT